MKLLFILLLLSSCSHERRYQIHDLGSLEVNHTYFEFKGIENGDQFCLLHYVKSEAQGHAPLGIICKGQ